MTPLLFDHPISEHAGFPSGLSLDDFETIYKLSEWRSINFKNNPKKCCIQLNQSWFGKMTLQSSYYIGTDWLQKGELAIYVEPKINSSASNTDYFKMLFEGFKNPDVSAYLPDIFEMKLAEPQIILPSKFDLLTPLLVYQFLTLLKDLVRKGLKKSHQAVEQNLPNRVKGKILVGQQIKQNVLKNNLLKNYCRFNTFSVDGPENRVLKKALLFATRYVESGSLKEYTSTIQKLLNYIRPAFVEVGDIATTEDLRNFKVNAFFKEYRQALHLAQMIFKRYGFNINSIQGASETISVPPFWIDMSKLYELYVLAHLRKQEYGLQIIYQPKGNHGAMDFLLTTKNHHTVIDAKYKPYYDEEYVIDDIRQLSGYARDLGVLQILNTQDDDYRLKVVDCLIIYPLKKASDSTSFLLNDLKTDSIEHFNKFYKKALELPFQKMT